MSDSVAVRLAGVGKMYKLFATRGDNFLDALGLGQVVPWHRVRYREFWALRGIDLDVHPGQRVGVIGRNGAGKTTLLKLITGNLGVSEGVIETNGRVQALLEAGGGFHPDFTGYENIRAALTYQGLGAREIAAAERDIADFTELGYFLEQPLKTYSLGMQARLGFAVATAVAAEILIIDEVLGAGDAYFFAKSTARMRTLVEGGAAVLIVSHALDQIVRFCEEAIWLDRGRIVMQGPSLGVVKAYERFVRVLEDRRLRARNRKLASPVYAPEDLDAYADKMLVRLTVSGEPGAYCDVSEVSLIRDQDVEDRLLVGDPQDSDIAQSAFLLSEDGNAWSAPARADGRAYRALRLDSRSAVMGSVLFNLYAFMPESAYAVDICYRSGGSAEVTLELLRNGAPEGTCQLPPSRLRNEWAKHRVELARRAPRMLEPDAERAAVSRWPGVGILTLERVLLVGADGRERALFDVGEPLTVLATVTALAEGAFPVIPAAVLFRLDGVLITKFIGAPIKLELTAGERSELRLEIAPLNLGNGHYVVSLGLYRKLDMNDAEEPEIYDLIDRSYEFQVVGTPPMRSAIFQHAGEWKVL